MPKWEPPFTKKGGNFCIWDNIVGQEAPLQRGWGASEKLKRWISLLTDD